MMAVSRRALGKYVAQQLAAGNALVIDELAAYLVQERRLTTLDYVVDDIARELTKLGHVSATITTARKLDPTLRTAVERQVRAMNEAKQIELIEVVDPALLGGIVIETPGRRFDASVRGRLRRLKQV
ncbi:MAG TPA: F0F1 ATP synthase subunit delta [Candidatus Saccharimonadales bacterium]|jgi:F-type H+-transporting ATPase subunit delta